MRCSSSIAANLRSVHSENSDDNSAALTGVGEQVGNVRARTVYTQSSDARQRHAEGETHSTGDKYRTGSHRQNGRAYRALQAIPRLRQVRMRLYALSQL